MSRNDIYILRMERALRNNKIFRNNFRYYIEITKLKLGNLFSFYFSGDFFSNINVYLNNRVIDWL